MDTGLFKNKYRINSIRLPGYDYRQNGYYFVTICAFQRQLFFGRIGHGRMILDDAGRIVARELLQTPAIRPSVRLDAWMIMPNHIHFILAIDYEYPPIVDFVATMMPMTDALFGKTPIVGAPNVKTPVVGAPIVFTTIVFTTVETPCQGVSTENMENMENTGNTDNTNNTGNMFNTKNAKNADNININNDGLSHIKNSDVNKNNNGLNNQKLSDQKSRGGYRPQWQSGSLGAIINQFKRQCTKLIRQNINPDFAWQSRFYDHIIRNEKSLNRIRQYIINNPGHWPKDRFYY